MVLDKYISDLLYRYECVIVPGFGGFITNKVSAKNISSQHKFLPPTKEIAFNKNLDKNDGLLANYLVQAKDISYSHALEIISNNVADWNTLLDEDNTFDIKKIGNFRLNEDRNIEFTAEENVNYLTESYGLSAFTSLAIKRAGEKAKVKPISGDNFKAGNSTLGQYVKYAAIIIPFIAIGALSFYQMNTVDNAPVSSAKISIVPDEVITDNLPTTKKESAKEETKVVKVKKITKTPKVKAALENKIYHVISGAYSNQSNAEKDIRILKNKGINAEMIGINRKGFYMVSFKSFSDISSASNFMKTIKSTENKNAWIWKKDLK